MESQQLLISNYRSTPAWESSEWRPEGEEHRRKHRGKVSRGRESSALWDKTRSFSDIKNSLSHERGSERSERASERTSERCERMDHHFSLYSWLFWTIVDWEKAKAPPWFDHRWFIDLPSLMTTVSNVFSNDWKTSSLVPTIKPPPYLSTWCYTIFLFNSNISW